MWKVKRDGFVSIFVILCMLLNIGGKLLAQAMQLPLWLDSFGTVLSAYVLGPVCGAIVGASVNIIYGILFSYTYMVYGLISIALGIIVGICARKGYLKNVFGVLSISFFLTLLSVCASTPLNYLFFDGSIGNVWGDGVRDLLAQMRWKPVICHIIGEFYMEFVDKVVTLFLLYLSVKMFKWMRKKKREKRVRKKQKTVLYLLIFGMLWMEVGLPSTVQASVDGGAAQNNYSSYIQTVYDRENGLPGGVANDITQSKDGVLWIGTYSGLYRYSGSGFQLMDGFGSVKNVNCLYTDEAGRMWIGTNDSGLSICINDRISNVLSRENGLPADSVRCVTQGADGNYYVGTTDRMAVVSLSGGLSVVDTMKDITYAKSVSADENGNVAAVTDAGTLYLVQTGSVKDQVSLEKGYYQCCAFDEQGNLYAGTDTNEIHVYQIADGKICYTSTIVCGTLNCINSINFFEDGVTFLCADNGIGYLDQTAAYQLVSTDSFNSSIEHMEIDYQGNLWFTSSRQGLMRMCRSVFSEVYGGNKNNPSIVNTVTKWQKYLVIGTDNGLVVLDEQGTECADAPLAGVLDGVRVRCMRKDKRDHLWIATSGMGVIEALPDGNYHVYDSSNGTGGDKFRSIVELSDGTIAVCGDAGITMIKNGAVIMTIGADDGMKNPKTLCLLERKDGTVFAGTDGDGIAVIRDGRLEKFYRKKDGLGSEVILRMTADEENGGVFIVTSNSISYMDAQGALRVLDNFPYFNNYDLIEGPDDMLFVLGSAGIYVVEKNELLSGKQLEYLLLNEKKGLQESLTPNAWNYVDDSANLYFSADKSVVSLDLGHYDIAVRSYRMILRSVRADDVTYMVENGVPILLDRDVERITFSPEIINYSVNDPYVSVWLEGFEEKRQIFQQSALSDIVYTNLPSGDYTFHIAIMNNGKNTASESSYKIIKEEEIYDNWWFRVYMVLVFALAIIYLTWLFFRTQIQKTINMQRRELALAKKQVELGNEAIITIARTVDAKDENTSQHSIRVSEYAVMIARRMGYDATACDELRRTALLHDIGKIGIPDRVLNKPARLTDEEYDIMKSHVVKGAEILKNFTLLDRVEEGALYHHERYDGSGYVHGLKGEEIPLNARIIGIADAFDAMTANRVYRQKLDFDYVLEELKKGRGTQFDPRLTDVMLELIEDGTINVEKLYESTDRSSGMKQEKESYNEK